MTASFAQVLPTKSEANLEPLLFEENDALLQPRKPFQSSNRQEIVDRPQKTMPASIRPVRRRRRRKKQPSSSSKVEETSVMPQAVPRVGITRRERTEITNSSRLTRIPNGIFSDRVSSRRLHSTKPKASLASSGNQHMFYSSSTEPKAPPPPTTAQSAIAAAMTVRRPPVVASTAPPAAATQFNRTIAKLEKLLNCRIPTEHRMPDTRQHCKQLVAVQSRCQAPPPITRAAAPNQPSQHATQHADLQAMATAWDQEWPRSQHQDNWPAAEAAARRDPPPLPSFPMSSLPNNTHHQDYHQLGGAVDFFGQPSGLGTMPPSVNHQLHAAQPQFLGSQRSVSQWQGRQLQAAAAAPPFKLYPRRMY